MTICLTVTNDLSYDQRMIRICSSLVGAGHKVELIGRLLKNSLPLFKHSFKQKRLKCFFYKGKLFYAEYNIRLFFYLLFKKTDCICAIDLDTILPVLFCSKLKKAKRVYDAHELFCEMKEIVTRPKIYSAWKKIEKFSVPKFTNGYTVNRPIAREFKKMYDVNYEIIRSVSLKQEFEPVVKDGDIIIYQGAVNEGRSFETLIPAMQRVNAELIIFGDGNFFEQAKALVKKNILDDKIIFRGKVEPGILSKKTREAKIGVTLFDDKALSNYYSLANRFFDYIHAGIPQLCVNYPAYEEINKEFEVALLIDDLSPENIARNLNRLLQDEDLYYHLQQNCLKASEAYCWQNEEKKLIEFYRKIEQE
ncbi:MAG: glycosyltransferase [Bacteroidota bacterium]|nr:glycosyltransferase [Bacteroidota bacterium]